MIATVHTKLNNMKIHLNTQVKPSVTSKGNNNYNEVWCDKINYLCSSEKISQFLKIIIR